MRTYFANQTVEPGLYFNPREFRFESMDETAKLPGAPEDRFLRVPMIALLVVGPILGLVYAVFLPFIGIAMIAGLAAKKLLHWAVEGTRALGRFAHHT